MYSTSSSIRKFPFPTVSWLMSSGSPSEELISEHMELLCLVSMLLSPLASENSLPQSCLLHPERGPALPFKPTTGHGPGGTLKFYPSFRMMTERLNTEERKWTLNNWTPGTEALLFTEFSRQEYWSGLPFPSPWALPDPGIEPRSPALQGFPNGSVIKNLPTNAGSPSGDMGSIPGSGRSSG